MSIPQIFALSIVEIIGDFGYKEFANKGGVIPFIIGTIGYIGVVFMLIVSLQNSTILMVNGAWDGISGLVEGAVAYFFLGERFHNPLQYLGIVIISFGLFLLHIPKNKEKPFVWPKIW